MDLVLFTTLDLPSRRIHCSHTGCWKTLHVPVCLTASALQAGELVDLVLKILGGFFSLIE